MTSFTLAEVLIVLGIIGLIADMTIPTLVMGFKEKAAVSQLQKAYATYTNAFNMAVTEEGTADNWNLIERYSPEGAKNGLDIMLKHLKIIKNCGNDTGCFPDVKYKNLNGAEYTNINQDNMYAKALLADGSSIAFYVSTPNCIGEQYCGQFYYDINGFKGPNQWGIDTFIFGMYRDRIIPAGSAKVSPETSSSFERYCRDKKTQNGWSCAAWVLYNGNMDYLHCDDLSWAGKKSCK